MPPLIAGYLLQKFGSCGVVAHHLPASAAFMRHPCLTRCSLVTSAAAYSISTIIAECLVDEFAVEGRFWGLGLARILD